jgi:hypothetical protein
MPGEPERVAHDYFAALSHHDLDAARRQLERVG